MSGSPAVSVVIPSFNGGELLDECLQSLRAQTFPADQFEIIVVDNGSSDGTSEWLRASHPDVTVIRADTNLGFAEGTNRGATAARGDWLVFLNNDTFATPQFIEELLRVARSADVACVAGRILDWDGTQIEFGGASLTVFGFGFQRSSWQPGFSESREGDALPFACGAAMLIKASVFADLGRFDVDYFAYYEDVDLGWRLWLSGQRIVYAPLAEVRHHRYATAKKLAGRQQHFFWYRNGLATLFKNSEDSWIRQILPFAFATSLHRISALHGLAAQERAHGELAKAEFLLESALGAADGINWILEHIDLLREKRAAIQSRRCIADRSLADEFGLSLDFGVESNAGENAFALRLLPLIDLSGLMSSAQIASGALESATRLATEAAEAQRLRVETVALGRELDMRNHEGARLHRDLHDRNLKIESTETTVHERNLEIERLNRELHERNLQLQANQSRLNEVLASRSWRWTAPLRALLRRNS